MVLFDAVFPYPNGPAAETATGARFTSPGISHRTLRSQKHLRPAGEVYGYQKVLFLACYDAGVARSIRVIPEDSRHADLPALCMWQAYDQMMLTNLLNGFGGR